MTLITFVRHGQTDWNLQRRIQGSTDIPLNETGREQALRAAESLGAETPWDLIVCSPLVRASETGQIIANHLHLDAPVAVAGLQERAHGDMEGMTFEQRQAAFPHGADVPGLESRDDVVRRVLSAVRSVVDGCAGGRIIAVSHGGVIGSLVRYTTSGEMPTAGQIIANGSNHDFEWRDDDLQLACFRPVEADPELHGGRQMR